MPEQAAPPTSPVELLRGLAVLCEPPTEAHVRLAEALGLPSVPTSAEHADLFVFQLYPFASVHLGAGGKIGGEARARVAGFWTALGFEPPKEPDHLAALLGLYATLGEREAEGSHARRALLDEHLAPWVFAYLDRVIELTDGPYRLWAELLSGVLRREVERAPRAGSPDVGASGASGGLPLHLREAPDLPDPREGGSRDFLDALLAPVRSGFTTTRADLARMARELDLGLRAGERRYALESLLSQDASAVLRWLAAEARRQEASHRARAGWLGASATFVASRARAAARLLDALARSAVEVSEQ